MKVKIYVLVDNCASGLCRAEHGLSYIVEYDNTVLFDAGQSNLFIDNAINLNAPLQKVSYAVLSHGHYDHGNGLIHFGGVSLVCHPGAFVQRFSGKQRKPIGLNITKGQLAKKYNIIETNQPFALSQNMFYLGQIPRKIGFENTEKGFYLADGSPDIVPDDTAIAITTPKGLFIVSGCAHSGICNIIAHAQAVTGVKKVWGIIGGFHLQMANSKTIKTLNFIDKLNPAIVMPAHCTQLPALLLLYNRFKGEQVKAGTLYTFDTV